MMPAEAIEEVWLTYQVMDAAIKVASRSIKTGMQELLEDTVFTARVVDAARQDLVHCRSAAEDYVIFAMWAIFERRILSTLVQESGKMVDSPSSVFNKTVHEKVVDSIEYWRTDDLLDLIKPLVGGELAGQAKQIKRPRDWLAHKNPRKPSPGNVPPALAFKVLSEISRLLTMQKSQSGDVPTASDSLFPGG